MMRASTEMELLFTLATFIFSVHLGETSSPIYNPNYYENNNGDPNDVYETDTNNQNGTNGFVYASAFEEASVMYDDYESQALYIYKLFCRQSCQEDLGMLPNRFCRLCYCDSVCNYYGDCCPDYEDLDNSKLVDFSCQSSNVPFYGNYIKLVDSCPDDFAEEEIVLKCEYIDSDNWRSIQLVTDPKTLVSYRNRYCAECHNVGNDVVKWKAGAICEEGPPKFYSNTSNDDVYRKTINTPGCNVIFIPPYNETFRECSEDQFSYERVCNLTSEWPVYDPAVERGCLTYHQNEALYYPNVFCYLCNTALTWEEIKADIVGKRPNVFKESLTAYLDLYEESENQQNECQFKDPYKCTCGKISCAEEKKYENNECKSVYYRTNSYIYHFCVQATLVFDTNVILSNDTNDFLNSFILLLHNLQGVVYYGYYNIIHVSPCGAQMNVSVFLDLNVFFREPVDTDYFENQILSIERQGLNLTKQYIKTKFTVKESCENDKVVEFKEPCDNYTFKISLWTEIADDFKEELSLITATSPFYFSRFVSCPRVFLSKNQVEISPSNQTLTILANGKTLKSGDFQSNQGGYSVCVEDYLVNNSPGNDVSHCHERPSSKNQSYSVLGILSGICTGLSVLFLIFTLVIFWAVKYLRTTVGLGIMVLSLLLIIAQSLFEFGADISEIPWVCQTIGVLTHFFWLSSTFWMNVCTVILFCKLNFPIKSRTYSSKKIIFYSTLYTWVSSAIIISAVMITSYLNDGSIGYGGSTCYIATPNSRRFGFALPVVLIVLINVTLSSYTFIKLKRTNQLQSTHENQVSMLGCLKLSVITGLTWIFALIFEVTGNFVFAYISTLCMGFHGVVIFLVFVANKRVMNMVKQSLRV